LISPFFVRRAVAVGCSAVSQGYGHEAAGVRADARPWSTP